jgi:glycosyltransferase involved in cell wall biosynthesis
MKVLHLLGKGGVGGIEELSKNYGNYSCLDNAFLVLWKPGAISEEILKNGFSVEVYNTAPKRYIPDFIRFIKKCKNEKVDVLVCSFGAPLISLCVIGLRLVLKNINIVGYVHSNPEEWGKKEYYFGKIVYHYADKIVCISDNVMESVRNKVGYDEKLVLIYNGVEMKRFSGAEIVMNKKEEIKVIYVGRLEKVKGVQNILTGLLNVRDSILYDIKIIGDGTYKQELEELSKQYGISNSVEFLGTRRDIPQLLFQSDVFVHMPDCKEGFGITIIEAMAAGLICIVNDQGALPEIIRDGVNGFIVGKSTGRNFEDTIKFVHEQYRLGDPNGRLKEICIMARERAMAFSIEVYAQQMDQLIKGLKNKSNQK